jgi:hypothetical protein
MYLKGLWLSPNKKYLYFIEDSTDVGSTRADIRALNLSSWVVSDVTKGAEVYLAADAFRACDNGSKMYVAYEPVAQTSTLLELAVFDMDLPTTALQLTTVSSQITASSYNYLRDILVSPDCDHVVFTTGFSTTYDIFGGRASAPVTISKFTSAPSGTANYVSEQRLVSPDNALMVFLSGPASTSYTLQVAPLQVPGKATSIFSGPGGVPAKYWMLLGIK